MSQIRTEVFLTLIKITWKFSMGFEIWFCDVAARFFEDQRSKAQEAELIYVDFSFVFFSLQSLLFCVLAVLLKMQNPYRLYPSSLLSCSCLASASLWKTVLWFRCWLGHVLYLNITLNYSLQLLCGYWHFSIWTSYVNLMIKYCSYKKPFWYKTVDRL